MNFPTDGKFKNNLFEGDDIIYYSNGDKYEGQWEDGMRNGNGIYNGMAFIQENGSMIKR